ncbi:MAG TPA: hypothetical protein VNH16_24415 [Burkholderiales bacterium]|jgi:ElaB/YqjD/DUF883 family membrane-anchored ribosome-binding protein|nr:hypothetical protein [Burkholderiales bacterium]
MEYAQSTKIPSSVEEVPTSTEERLRHMRQSVDQYMSTASQRAREAAAYADRTVQANPWSAVGVGFGLGMVFGAMITLLASRPNPSMLDRFR